jgi:hypothetical protein
MRLEPLYLPPGLPPSLAGNAEAIAEAAAEGTAISPPLNEGGNKENEEAGREGGKEGEKVAETQALPVMYSCPFPFLLKTVAPSRLASAPVLLGVFVDGPGVQGQGGREGGREGGVLMVPGNAESRRAVLVVHVLDSEEAEQGGWVNAAR